MRHINERVRQLLNLGREASKQADVSGARALDVALPAPHTVNVYAD